MLLLLPWLALAATPEPLVLEALGDHLVDPSGDELRTREDVASLLALVPASEVRVRVGEEATVAALDLLLRAAHVASPPLYLEPSEGPAVGPLLLGAPWRIVGPRSRLTGVATAVGVQLRPDEQGPLLAVLSPYAVSAPAAEMSEAELAGSVAPGDPFLCSILVGADTEVCENARTVRPPKPYLRGDQGCAHTSAAALSARVRALGLGAVESPVMIEVQPDDDLGAIVATARTLLADGHTVGLWRGTPEAFDAPCTPVVDEAAQVRPAAVAWYVATKKEPAPFGSLAKSAIDKVVKRGLRKVRQCYQRELVRDRSLEGKITVRFVIEPDGSVRGATIKSSTMDNASVEACLVQTFLGFRFPRPDNDGIVIVAYPFVFQP